MTEQEEAVALLHIIDTYGIRFDQPFSSPAKPYEIHISLQGHGQTTCCGECPSDAARIALDWLTTRNAR